jgi:hypothetical protein
LQNLRPSIPARWGLTEPLASISRMIRECWHKDPRARPSMLRIKKNLQNLNPENSPEIMQKFAKIHKMGGGGQHGGSSTVPMMISHVGPYSS